MSLANFKVVYSPQQEHAYFYCSGEHTSPPVFTHVFDISPTSGTMEAKPLTFLPAPSASSTVAEARDSRDVTVIDDDTDDAAALDFFDL